MTDAAFRGPWLKAVEAQGWDWVGRIRNKINEPSLPTHEPIGDCTGHPGCSRLHCRTSPAARGRKAAVPVLAAWLSEAGEPAWNTVGGSTGCSARTGVAACRTLQLTTTLPAERRSLDRPALPLTPASKVDGLSPSHRLTGVACSTAPASYASALLNLPLSSRSRKLSSVADHGSA